MRGRDEEGGRRIVESSGRHVKEGFQYFPMVLKGSNGGWRISVMLCSFSKSSLISQSSIRISYTISRVFTVSSSRLYFQSNVLIVSMS